jgi:aspartyl protease family protein
MFEKLAIAGTIAAGLAIGVLWPTSHHSSRGAASEATDVVVARSSDRHFYADAQVNGHPVHFMIDTGASETALTEDDAKAVGIPFDPNNFEVIGDGASGMVRGQYVQLKSIELNGIKQQDAKVVVVQGADVSLLGQPFLENVDEIVIRHDEMRLRPSAHS